MAITKATASSIAPAAKGDLVAGSATNDAAVLGVGANNTVLTADSAEATGLKWAAAAGGGKVLQVVQGSSTTSTSITSTSFTDSGLSASITPTLATSKILVLINQSWNINRLAKEMGYSANIMRGATQVYATAASVTAAYINMQTSNETGMAGFLALSYLDSPATTSATTYKTQGKCFTTADSASLTFQWQSGNSTITLLEIGV